MASGMTAVAGVSGDKRRCTRVPARHHIARLASQSADPHAARVDPAFDARARVLRQQPRQGGVQALPGQFFGNFEVDELELVRSLEHSKLAAGHRVYCRASK